MLCPFLLFSQAKTDSLWVEFEKATDDSIRIGLLHQLFDQYYDNTPSKAKQTALEAIRIAEESGKERQIATSYNKYGDYLRSQSQSDSAITVYRQGLEFAENSGYSYGQSMSLIGLGNSYWRKGNFNKAREYHERNIALIQNTENRASLASSFNSLGAIHTQTGEYTKAMDYYTQASEIFRELNDMRNYGTALGNIGFVQRTLENYESAEDYFLQIDSLYTSLDSQSGKAFAIYNLGIVYRNTGRLDQAIIANNKALEMYERLGARERVAYAHYSMGKIYNEKENVGEALNHYVASLDIAAAVGDSVQIGYSSVAVGESYLKLNEIEKAKEYLQRAVAVSKNIDLDILAMDVFENLSTIYAGQSDYANAYEYKSEYARIRDSLYTKETRELASEIEARYQNEQKEKEIALLATENNLKTLQLQKRKNERNATIAFSLFALIFAGLLYNQYRVKRKANDKLKELDQFKSNFFANISHEFRTPLTLILGQVQQLESGVLTDGPEPVYQMIKRNGQRVLGLVNQLLALSTLESGKMKLQVEKTNLVSFLKSVVAAYESLAESKGIQFDFDPGEENLPVYIDRDKIENVVQNVISNAFKFTPEGGRITVSVDQNHPEGFAQIGVQDSGPGIAPDQLDKIFDRFYQVNDTPTKYGEGSGIGLALAKELVTLHKGTISAESEVGKGSCFTISLPLGRKHLQEDEIVTKTSRSGSEELEHVVDMAGLEMEAVNTGSSPSDGTAGDEESDSANKPQILVIEDNTDMRQYIRQILDPNYRIEEAPDGSEGLEKAFEIIPDLIISDVMMPEMDGMELCSKLKQDERTSHIPVVLLTAKAGKESKLEGLKHHADDYLTKPFDADELLALLRNRIEQRARLRERFSREITLQPKEIAITSADERFLQRAIDIVEEHIDDFEFSVETFVEQMHLGRTQVNKKLKALTDLSAVQFIRSQRLKRAAQKISGQEDTISQIAYSVGFNNLSYFARCFKEQFGVAPSEYTGEQ